MENKQTIRKVGKVEYLECLRQQLLSGVDKWSLLTDDEEADKEKARRDITGLKTLSELIWYLSDIQYGGNGVVRFLLEPLVEDIKSEEQFPESFE